MQDRIAGWAIIVSALLSLVVIAHHPTVHTVDPSAMISGVTTISNMDELVHSVMLVFVTALLFGLTVFSMRLGLYRTLPLLGLIVYALLSVALTAAAVLDGFPIPSIAREYATATDPATARIGASLISNAAMQVQEFTGLALFAWCAGVVCWSIALLKTARSVVPRIAGIVGMLSAIYTAVAVIAVGHLGPHSLLGIMAAQNLWYLFAGALLLRGELPESKEGARFPA